MSTARLARELRPRDLGDGRLEVTARRHVLWINAGDGLRIWLGDEAFDLEPAGTHQP